MCPLYTFDQPAGDAPVSVKKHRNIQSGQDLQAAVGGLTGKANIVEVEQEQASGFSEGMAVKVRRFP